MDRPTTDIFTLSLHDALPISAERCSGAVAGHAAARHARRLVSVRCVDGGPEQVTTRRGDRKSTRLNSSHQIISYAVFCLKKKKPSTPIPLDSTNRERAP